MLFRSLASLVSPMIGAGLAGLGYHLLFGVSVVAYFAAALVLTRGVTDPRHGRNAPGLRQQERPVETGGEA